MSFPDKLQPWHVVSWLLGVIIMILICHALCGCAKHTVFAADGKTKQSEIAAYYPYEITVGPLTARPNEIANRTVETLGGAAIKSAPELAGKVVESITNKVQP